MLEAIQNLAEAEAKKIETEVVAVAKEAEVEVVELVHDAEAEAVKVEAEIAPELEEAVVLADTGVVAVAKEVETVLLHPVASVTKLNISLPYGGGSVIKNPA